MNTQPYFLYVEDDDEDIVLLKDMMDLTTNSSKFISVKNGFEAIKFLQGIKKGQTFPSLILMDVQMPRLNGQETLEFLKSDDVYCLIPVLMFSVSENPEQAGYFGKMRTEILPKPGNFKSWKDAIKKINSYLDENL
jgi:two-component system, response regulator